MHSAVGTWPNPSHVVGWGLGTHPMPLVLVQDCADALARLVEVERLESRSFNLVGDVRLTPREYTSALAAATGRRVHFHASPLLLTYAADLVKWLIKLATRRPGTVFPNWRDLATRSQRAQFDTTKTKRALRWEPETNARAFVKRGIQCVDEPLDQPSTEHPHRLEQ